MQSRLLRKSLPILLFIVSLLPMMGVTGSAFSAAVGRPATDSMVNPPTPQPKLDPKVIKGINVFENEYAKGCTKVQATCKCSDSSASFSAQGYITAPTGNRHLCLMENDSAVDSLSKVLRYQGLDICEGGIEKANQALQNGVSCEISDYTCIEDCLIFVGEPAK